MTQNNDTTKALVLYVPPVAESHGEESIGKKCLNRIYSFYNSRSKHYYAFLILFVVVSVFARCIHLRAPSVCNELFSGIEEGYRRNGFYAVVFEAVFVQCFFYAVFAFMSGFTVFALPLSYVSAFHLYYTASFVFFGTIDRALEQSFFECFCFIALFAIFIVLSTIYFTETRLFYGRTIALVGKGKQFAVYLCLFCLYLLFSVCALFFGFNSLFS